MGCRWRRSNFYAFLFFLSLSGWLVYLFANRIGYLCIRRPRSRVFEHDGVAFCQTSHQNAMYCFGSENETKTKNFLLNTFLQEPFWHCCGVGWSCIWFNKKGVVYSWVSLLLVQFWPLSLRHQISFWRFGIGERLPQVKWEDGQKVTFL